MQVYIYVDILIAKIRDKGTIEYGFLEIVILYGCVVLHEEGNQNLGD
jgi:hypothetical protein